MKALDTNVVVRFLTQDDAEQSAKATALMQSLSPREPALVPVVVWVETYWVLTRAYGVDKASALGVLRQLADRDQILAEAAPVIVEALDVASMGAEFPDAVIAASARQAGCSTVVTFDRHAAKTLGLELM